MSAITDALIAMLSGSIKALGETKLVEILQKLHDSDIDQYKAAIFGGRALVKALLPLTAKSATKIDDMLIQAIGEAIEESAKANGGI